MPNAPEQSAFPNAACDTRASGVDSLSPETILGADAQTEDELIEQIVAAAKRMEEAEGSLANEGERLGGEGAGCEGGRLGGGNASNDGTGAGSEGGLGAVSGHATEGTYAPVGSNALSEADSCGDAAEAAPSAIADTRAAEPTGSDTTDESEEEADPFPRERIVALPSWCTAPRGSGCTRCAAACPTGAISLNDGTPVIDEAQCTRCGICAGVCDAFAWERFTLKDLFERARTEAEEEGYACFTCNDHLFPGVVPRSNVLVLPCLAAVPPEFWTALLAADVPVKLYLDESYCEGCPTAGALGPALFAHALESAQDGTGANIGRVKELPERELLLAAWSHADGQDRRGMLSTLFHESKEIADGTHRKRNAAAVSDFREKQERMHAKARIRSEASAGSAWMPSKQAWPRQELMVQAAKATPVRAALMERYCSTTDCQKCTGAHECISACPTGARTAITDSDCPEVDPKLCIACGACIGSCPTGACDFAAITAQAYCSEE